MIAAGASIAMHSRRTPAVVALGRAGSSEQCSAVFPRRFHATSARSRRSRTASSLGVVPLGGVRPSVPVPAPRNLTAAIKTTRRHSTTAWPLHHSRRGRLRLRRACPGLPARPGAGGLISLL